MACHSISSADRDVVSSLETLHQLIRYTLKGARGVVIETQTTGSGLDTKCTLSISQRRCANENEIDGKGEDTGYYNDTFYNHVVTVSLTKRYRKVGAMITTWEYLLSRSADDVHSFFEKEMVPCLQQQGFLQ